MLLIITITIIAVLVLSACGNAERRENIQRDRAATEEWIGSLPKGGRARTASAPALLILPPDES